jgi:hypothetical protein
MILLRVLGTGAQTDPASGIPVWRVSDGNSRLTMTDRLRCRLDVRKLRGVVDRFGPSCSQTLLTGTPQSSQIHALVLRALY